MLFSINAAGQTDLYVLPLTPGGGKPEPRALLQTPFQESRGTFSPDGQWIVFQSNESGRSQIYAMPFPGPGGKHQISSAGGVDARWSRDGKEIFYVTDSGQLMSVAVASHGGTLDVGREQKLFDGVVTSRGVLYDVSADGQKFLVADDGANSSQPLTLVQNWTALLKK